MITTQSATVLFEAPLREIELSLIADFLSARGYDLSSLAALPSTERQALLKRACLYASSRLAEIESRSHFFEEI